MRRLCSHPKTLFLAATDSDAISRWVAMAASQVGRGIGSLTKVATYLTLKTMMIIAAIVIKVTLHLSCF
jgi:hypothetical protein